MSYYLSSTSLLHALGGLESTKKIMTALACIVIVVWMYKRIERGRAAERVQAEAAAAAIAHRNNMSFTTSRAHSSSSSSSSHTSSSASPVLSTSSSSTFTPSFDVRLLSPTARYLSAAGSKGRKQISDTAAQPPSSSSSSSPTSTLTLTPSARVILKQLATFTQLHLIAIQPNKEIQSSILSCLDSEGLLISGLATHHVLFCATLKGKASIYRHLEPHLLMDDDWQTVQEMKKYVDQAVFVGGGTENKGVKEGVHCVGRLEEFFL